MTFSLRISKFLSAAAGGFLLIAAFTSSAVAQLRPLDPTDFRALEGRKVRAQLGTGVYFEQHASLVGTKGRLVEAGNVRVSWRSGRFLLELAGTVQRFFREEKFVEAPAEGVIESSQTRTRHDAGDYRVQTVLRLTNDTAATAVILRFGTRLPTTDNRVGLERDQMDFFASIGAARSLGRMFVAAEAGLGINGTRLSNYEQADVLIYAATIERRARVLSPFVSVTGQNDMHRYNVRGNEDLGEIRAGLRIGNHRWVNFSAVRGYHESSPRAGFVLNVGASF